MNISSYFKSYLLTLCLLFVASACNDEYGQCPDIASDGPANMLFTLNIPGTNMSKTKTITEADETHVASVSLLAFKENGGTETFLYHAEGRSITGAGNQKRFTVSLQKSADGNERQRFVILTNLNSEVQSAIGTFGSTTTKEEALEAITFATSGKWNAAGSTDFTPLPMWGESKDTYVVTNTLQSSHIGTIQMLRAVVRVDVGLDLSGDEAQGLPEFTLSDVQVYNYNDRGAIAPLPAHYDKGAGVVSTVTLPSAITRIKGPLDYEIADGKGCVRKIYLSESLNRGNNNELTCVVVGGYYRGSAEKSWYRVDFWDRSTDPGISQRFSLLRNHRYRINITAVEGVGYPTPDEAFNSSPVQLEAEVTEWNEGIMNDVEFDGQYLFSVSKGEFEFDFQARDESSIDNIFKVTTDVPGGWELDKIVNEDNTLIEWVSLAPANGPVGTTDCKIIAAGNGTIPQTYFIHLKAGRLTYKIKMTQGIQAADILYFANDGTLSIGKSKDGTITQANLAFFKFGSVVGFTNDGTTWNSNMSQIRFNPTSLKINSSSGDIRNYGTTATTLPSIPGYETSDWNNSIKNVSDNNYHNAVNVKTKGKGDPCRLVGLSDAQVQLMTASEINSYKSGWRLPDKNENIDFVGAPASWYNSINSLSLSNSVCNFRAPQDGIEGGWFSIPGNRNSTTGRVIRSADMNGFIPAGGIRYNNSVSGSVGSSGFYWSGTAYSNTGGYCMSFNSSVAPFNNAVYSMGFPVRCVPTGDTPSLPPADAPPILGFSKEQFVFTYPMQNVTSGASNDLTITTAAEEWFILKILDDSGADASSWVSLSVSRGGTGSTDVKIILSKNTGGKRVANIYIQARTFVKLIKVNQEAYLDGGAADILYFAPGSRLTVGKWGDPAIMQNNIAFFKFGSVIGFTNDGTAWNPNLTQIRFNPSGLTINQTAGDIQSYGIDSNTLPAIPGYETIDWTNGVRDISMSSYHNGANVKTKGKGDPCKLVGLTPLEIRAMSAEQINTYSSGWRMPTENENIDFVGAPDSWYGGIPQALLNITYWNPDPSSQNGGWFPIPGDRSYVSASERVLLNSDPNGFLPAVGNRDGKGASMRIGTFGRYRSSTPVSSSDCIDLGFDNRGVYPLSRTSFYQGFAIRCVRD